MDARLMRGSILRVRLRAAWALSFVFRYDATSSPPGEFSAHFTECDSDIGGIEVGVERKKGRGCSAAPAGPVGRSVGLLLQELDDFGFFWE